MQIIEKPTQEIIDAFQKKYNEDYENIGCNGYSVEDISQHIRELAERLSVIFPQEESFDALVSVCYGGEWKEGDAECIIHALEEMPHFKIEYCVVHDKHVKLEQDEFEVLLTVGNIKNFKELKVNELLRRAVEDNDEDAVVQLGCHSQCYEYGESELFEGDFQTEIYVSVLLAGASTIIGHLRALAQCFRVGLVVDKDERMADILVDCANLAQQRNTEEVIEERSCGIDYTWDPYLFYSEKAEDRQYVFHWIEKTAASDSYFNHQALYMLKEYYNDGVECVKDPFRARQILVNQFLRFRDMNDLKELGCLPEWSPILEDVEEKLGGIEPTDYANYYKTLIKHNHEFYPCLYHLYECGFCTEYLEQKTWEQMNHFEQICRMAQSIKRDFNSPKERFEYLRTEIQNGSVPAIFFLDNDLCMAEMPYEERLSVIKMVYDIVVKGTSQMSKSYFVLLCHQYIDSYVYCEELYTMIKPFVEEGNKIAIHFFDEIEDYYKGKLTISTNSNRYEGEQLTSLDEAPF